MWSSASPGRTHAALAALIGLLLLMVAFAAPAADAYSVRKLAPARVTRSALVFRLSGIRPRSIRSARLVVRSRAYRMPVSRVRQAVRKSKGTLAVQRPAAAPGTDTAATLVIQVPAPAPSPAPAPTPPPSPPTP